MTINIRPEKPADYPVIHTVVKEAFAQAPHTNHDEHHLVERLRQSTSYIPDLALCALIEGHIIGHILFTKLPVGNTAALSLAPLAVLPEYQNRGAGSALIRQGHHTAKELGYPFSILVGHADYYPRFGYRPAAEFGISAPFQFPPENFMACDLQNSGKRLDGVVQYPPEFGL